MLDDSLRQLLSDLDSGKVRDPDVARSRRMTADEKARYTTAAVSELGRRGEFRHAGITYRAEDGKIKRSLS